MPVSRAWEVLAALLAVSLSACAIARPRVVKRAPTEATCAEQVDFYVQRLGDRRYVEYSPDREAPIAWHVAAEELGQIGVAAIPALMLKLAASTDVYELQQIFYALRLAVQHPNAESVVGSGHPMPIEAFPPAEAHAKLKAEWSAWWEIHEKAVTAAAAGASAPGA